MKRKFEEKYRWPHKRRQQNPLANECSMNGLDIVVTYQGPYSAHLLCFGQTVDNQRNIWVVDCRAVEDSAPLRLSYRGRNVWLDDLVPGAVYKVQVVAKRDNEYLMGTTKFTAGLKK